MLFRSGGDLASVVSDHEVRSRQESRPRTEPPALEAQALPSGEHPSEADLNPPGLEALARLARQLPPAQRPHRWLLCPELAPTAAGKWELGRWRAWLARQPAPPG